MKKAFKAPVALSISLTAMTALLSSGCGPQSFQATASQDQQVAPGTFTIAPKVDILLVEDDLGSIREVFSNVSSQMGQFLSGLQTRGWDYHLATIPLTTFRPIQQIQASQYDVNWGSQWLAPFPGATQSTVGGQVASANFRFPSDYTDFLDGSHTSLSSQAPGLHNIRQTLLDSRTTQSGFLRNDAFLAVVVISTDEDTSERNLCTQANGHARNDGWEGPCDMIQDDLAGGNPSIVCGQSGANPKPYCNNNVSSLNAYTTFFQNFKGNSQQIRFYSLTSKSRQIAGGCMGANSFAGTRLIQMSSNLNSPAYDVCTVPIPAALDQIANNLQTIRLNIRTRYLFLAQEPDATTITVTRHAGGDNSKNATIARDTNHSDGWDYVGNVSDVYAIDYPTNMNLTSGYAIELYGSAKLVGADTATVESTPAAVHNAVSK
ncbi:hypothetical protein WDW37_07095 [Bdellovibrionota bacterium FG-1]